MKCAHTSEPYVIYPIIIVTKMIMKLFVKLEEENIVKYFRGSMSLTIQNV